MKSRIVPILIPAAVLLLFAGLAGCSGSQESAGEPAAAAAPVAAHEAAPAPSLKFTAPAGWIQETPSSSMRQAQYKLPKVEGDPEDAEMAVFFFSGDGGSVQANIDRWIGQFQKNDGSPAKGSVSNREVHGVKLTIVDVSGIYLSGSGMMTETKPKPNFRMLAAVAETPAGPWFFKLTGPDKTIAKWEPEFQSFLDTIEKTS